MAFHDRHLARKEERLEKKEERLHCRALGRAVATGQVSQVST